MEKGSFPKMPFVNVLLSRQSLDRSRFFPDTCNREKDLTNKHKNINNTPMGKSLMHMGLQIDNANSGKIQKKSCVQLMVNSLLTASRVE